MPKLIQKCGYFKPHENRSVNYMKYIATRKGVEKIARQNADRPATERQRQLIASIRRDCPDAEELFEFADYSASPTVGNASAFIAMALDANWDAACASDIYMKYIATRPRAEKHGGHGLFSDRADVDLDEALAALSACGGNVWTFIFSLRREDAARLGYDCAAAWQSLIAAHRAELAEALKIGSGELCWYAAFHNESHHPHVHMMVYAKDPKEGYLSAEGIRALRSALTNTIFRQELLTLYERKSASRDELVQSAREAMAALIREMQSGLCDSPEIAARVSALAGQLQSEHGKLQYGYLKPRLKAMVDGIVDELERIPAVAECYEKWRELQGSVQSYYTGEAPERLPLSRQKEFKAIRNAVVREALGVADGTPRFESMEPEAAAFADTQAQEAAQCLADAAGDPEKLPQAIRRLEQAVTRGNPYAQFFIDHADEHVPPSALLSATRLLYQLGRIFQVNSAPPGNPNGIRIDSRRRRKLREMKIAAGHAADERDSEYSQSPSY